MLVQRQTIWARMTSRVHHWDIHPSCILLLQPVDSRIQIFRHHAFQQFNWEQNWKLSLVNFSLATSLSIRRHRYALDNLEKSISIWVQERMFEDKSPRINNMLVWPEGRACKWDLKTYETESQVDEGPHPQEIPCPREVSLRVNFGIVETFHNAHFHFSQKY